jgi:hypothetical protein
MDRGNYFAIEEKNKATAIWIAVLTSDGTYLKAKALLRPM